MISNTDQILWEQVIKEIQGMSYYEAVSEIAEEMQKMGYILNPPSEETKVQDKDFVVVYDSINNEYYIWDTEMYNIISDKTISAGLSVNVHLVTSFNRSEYQTNETNEQP